MKRFTSVDTSVLKQHYEKKVHELELEKRVLQVSLLRSILFRLQLRIEVMNWLCFDLKHLTFS